MDAISRLISLAMRAGVSTEAITKHLRGIRCPSPAWTENGVVLSCPDAIGLAIEHYVAWRQNGNGEHASEMVSEKLPMADVVKQTSTVAESSMGACPECGGHMKHEDGCMTCLFCGFSRCG
jgi:ribonucleoside-diphosphate reductase alpha chain